MDPVFSRKEPHQLRSKLQGHGRQTSVFSSVITNYCPWCRSTFSSTKIARKHAAASMLSGHCRVDAAFPWPISRRWLQRLIMPAVLEGTPASQDAPVGEKVKKRRLTRRKSVVGGRGLAQPRTETEEEVHGDAVVPAGSKKKPAAFCRYTTQLMGIIFKQCLRTEQDTRSLCGAMFDTVIMSTEHDVVKSVRAQTPLYNEGVQASGKGHTLGPPQILGVERIDRESPEAQGTAVGAANAATLTGFLKQLDRMSMDHARFCRVDRTYQSERARVTLAVDRSGVRDPVVSALRAARKCTASGGSVLEARGSFPSLPVSPSFSVRQRSSDVMTRGLQSVAPSRISSIPLTSRGVPSPSSSLEGSERRLVRASSGGNRMLTTLGVPPPSCLIESPSLGNSVSSSSVVPKRAGIVEGVETSRKPVIILDQQLTTVFQTGLRHPLDDSHHDAMSDLSEK